MKADYRNKRMLFNAQSEKHFETVVQTWVCDTIEIKVQKAEIFPKNYSLKEIKIYVKSIN